VFLEEAVRSVVLHNLLGAEGDGGEFRQGGDIELVGDEVEELSGKDVQSAERRCVASGVGWLLSLLRGCSHFHYSGLWGCERAPGTRWRNHSGWWMEDIENIENI
jgi:hypothetical protein